MDCFRKGIRSAVDFKDELFMNLFEALDVLYIRNGETPNSTFFLFRERQMVPLSGIYGIFRMKSFRL